MVTQCEKCKKNIIIQAGIYGSPLMRCSSCGQELFIEKIHEPALEPRPNITKEALDWWMVLSLIIGIGFILAGFLLYKPCKLWLSGFGLLMAGCTIYIIWSSNRNYKQRITEYDNLLAHSHERLSSFAYQQALVTTSKFNPNLIKKLKAYNTNKNYEFVLKVSENESLIPYETQSDSLVNDPLLEINELYCRKCGTKLLFDSEFCHRCGAKVILL